jgi:hypothetical protein
LSIFCKDCQFWLFVYKNIVEGDVGTCDHPVVEGKITLDQAHEDDEYVIHTAANFGCIYHTPHNGNVVTKIDV